MPCSDAQVVQETTCVVYYWYMLSKPMCKVHLRARIGYEMSLHFL